MRGAGQYLWEFFCLPPLPDFLPIQLLDLAVEHAAYQAELDAAWHETVRQAAFIQGPAVGEFAAELGAHLGGAYVVPCANGTDALTLALLSLGLPVGSEVIVPAFTYVVHSSQPDAQQWLAAHPTEVQVFQEWSKNYEWPKPTF